MKFRRFASIITVPAVLLIIYHLGLLVFDYNRISSGEGWGVLAVLATLFLLTIVLGIGMVIRYFIRNTGGRLSIELLLFLIILLIAIQNY